MDDVIKFTREKSLRLVRELQNGACGKTVLLYDDVIKENFVCKKFSPLVGVPDRISLFEKFIQEIKILHLASHPNIVRIFNYYIYLKEQAGFIIMEHVDGTTFDDYLSMYPEHIDNIFLQCLRGFEYLSELGILHRDIRPGNIMVTHSGVVKIIDFGFSKPATDSVDFDKSITLNWWATPPLEFSQGRYDYCSEVYFLGKLFQRIIIENKIEHFSYKSILTKMCEFDPKERFKKFSEINIESINLNNSSIIFSEDEVAVFRAFSSKVFEVFSNIDPGSKYFSDINALENGLDDLYKSVMLSEAIPKLDKLTEKLVKGNYRYFPSRYFEVEILKNFLHLLKSSSSDKKNLIMRNLYSILDSVKRSEPPPSSDEDIPF